MKYELIIFDWDGTLMDSISHIVESLQYAMRKVDVEVLSDDTTKNVIGLGMREAIETLFPSHFNEKFVVAYTQHYRDYFLDPERKTNFFSGARATLKSLSELNCRLAVATGKSRRGLDFVLSQTGIKDAFASSRCADECRSKPHADMILEILDELDVKAEKALMIGDTVYDLEMASNAGVDSIGVTYGVHSHAQLEKYAPINMVDNISEILPILKATTFTAMTK